MEIRAKARRLKSRHGLGMIVVDYLQLMSGRSDAENRQVEVSEISRGLKILARELEVPGDRPLPALPKPRDPGPTSARSSPTSGSRAACRPTPGSCGPTTARRSRWASWSSAQEQPLVWSVDEHQRLVPARLVKAFPSGIKPVFTLQLASGRSVDRHRQPPVPHHRRLDPARRPGAGVVHRHPPPAPGPAAAQRRLDRRRADAPRPPAGRRHDGLELQVRHRRPGQQGAGGGPGPSPLRDRDRRRQGRQHLAAVVPEPLPAHPRRAPPDAELAGAARAVEVEGVDQVLPRVDLRPPRRPGGAVPPPPVGHRRLDHHRPQRPGPDRQHLLRHHQPTPGPRRPAPPAPPRRQVHHRHLQEAAGRPSRRRRPRSTTGTASASASRVLPARPGSCARSAATGNGASASPRPWPSSTGSRRTPTSTWCPGRSRPGSRRPPAGPASPSARSRPAWARATAAAISSAPSSAPAGSPATVWRASPSIVGSQELADIASSDVYWDEVVEITSGGSQPTFDATVEGTHNFVADGVVAHNSSGTGCRRCDLHL